MKTKRKMKNKKKVWSKSAAQLRRLTTVDILCRRMKFTEMTRLYVDLQVLRVMEICFMSLHR